MHIAHYFLDSFLKTSPVLNLQFFGSNQACNILKNINNIPEPAGISQNNFKEMFGYPSARAAIVRIFWTRPKPLFDNRLNESERGSPKIFQKKVTALL